MITMTCNENWPKIKQNLRPSQNGSDNPMLVSRVFRHKTKLLWHLIIKEKIFGPVD